MSHLKEEKKEIIALTGGATGGHIFPLLSIYNYFKEEKKYDFIWIGEEDSLEEKIALENNIHFLDLPAGKLRRYFDIRNFFEPLKNLTGILYGIYYILKYKIDIVFSKGGYVSLPLTIAAFLLRKKIYIHESDVTGGIANKFIGKIATKVFYTFPNSNIDEKKSIVSGQILNSQLLETIDDLYIGQNEKLTVLVIGGSQGSTKIFDALMEALPSLEDINFHIILGEKNLHFRDSFEIYKNVSLHDFVTQKEMGKLLKTMDIAITRAGATSLWELNMFGIHSLIIPINGSAGEHQNKNASYFNENFGSDILNEDENLKDNIIKTVLKYTSLRKNGLNLKHFYKSLEIIEKEISDKKESSDSNEL